MLKKKYDVVIIGGGPAGSVTASYLAKADRSVLIIEKEKFPRFHIGESLTGMATQIIRDLDLEDEVNSQGFPPKEGVKVIGNDARSEFFVPVLVPTWQVRRSEFDELLLNASQNFGADYVKGFVKEVIQDDDRVVGIKCQMEDSEDLVEIECSYLVDASGQNTFLSRNHIAGKKVLFEEFANQVAIFSQFENAKRDPGRMGNNTFIFYSEDQRWAWFIPLSDKLVSIGTVMDSALIREVGGIEPAFLWGLKTINPDLASRVADATQVDETRRTNTSYSYSVDPFAGKGWLCVGDSHQFIDPIFSFGVSFAMVEAKKASETINLIIDGQLDEAAALKDYVDYCKKGQGVALDLIRYFWAFPVFFGYQARTTFRKDFVHILASDCHSEAADTAIAFMRKALAKKEAARVGSIKAGSSRLAGAVNE